MAVEQIQEVYVRNKTMILQLSMKDRNYLWELFISANNTLHSNKIIYKYSHLHIRNIFLYEHNVGIILADQLLVYFQYGLNRLMDPQTVLASEVVSLERHPILIDVMNIGDKEIEYVLMMPHSLYLIQIDDQSLLRHQYICEVDSRKSYEEWPTTLIFTNWGLCSDKDPFTDYCHEEQVVKVDYGEYGGHYGVSNKHIRFMAVWGIVLGVIVMLSVVCWRVLLRKAAKLREYEEKRSQALSALVGRKGEAR